MKTLYWVLLGLIFSTFCSAENLTVYRWVDENNVVHFSQHQPSHNNYAEMSLANISSPKKTTVSPATEEISDKPIVNSATDDKCGEAQANMRILKGFDKIQYTDAKGKAQVLDEKAKELQLQINQSQIDLYCSN